MKQYYCELFILSTLACNYSNMWYIVSKVNHNNLTPHFKTENIVNHLWQKYF